VLPDAEASGGVAGELLAGGGVGASSGAMPLLGGNAGELSASGNDAGGVAGSGVATGGQSGVAGAAGAAGELQAGAGGAAACETIHVLVNPSADSWIDAAEPQINHGADAQLFVLGGASEQRALFAFALPVPPAGSVFAGATLVLTLAQAPNLGALARVLNAHPLLLAFNEGRVSWLNYGNGASKMWANAGADFAAVFGRGRLRAGDSVLRLEVNLLVAQAYAKQLAGLGLLVRDPQTASVPVSFAFVSREGAAAAGPVLDLEFCPP